MLKHYLAPVLTEEEKKKFKAERENNKSLVTLGDGDALSEFDGALAPFGNDDEDDEGDDDDEEEDVENSDSNFQDDIEKIVRYSDMDQTLKGDNINLIGVIDGLGLRQ